MTRLMLIAHVATPATRRFAFATGDEPAEAAGLAAARRRKGGVPAATHAFASPASAARLTADALGLVPQACTALRDVAVGRWTGRGLDEIAPAAIAAWRADPGFVGHGGESLEALIARVAAALTARVAMAGTTIAITHAAVVRAAMVAALGAPASTFWLIDVPPLAGASFGSDGTRWSLRGFGPLPEALD